MSVRLHIEAATWIDLDSWLFRVTEYMELQYLGAELTVRAIGENQRVRRPFRLLLVAESPAKLKAAADIVRAAGKLWSTDQIGKFLEPEELMHGHYWRQALEAVRDLFASGLHLSLRQVDRPVYSKELIERVLIGWARSNVLTNEARSAVYSTLAAIETATSDAGAAATAAAS